MKVDGSFQGINPSDKSSVKRKSTAKRIVKAAVVAGVVVGGVALYKNRKTPAVQKIADILNNDILAPLKQKGINFWYGTSVTGKGAPFFGEGLRYNTFLSIEPLMENLEAGVGSFGGVRWIIVGAMTGPGSKEHQPHREWL